MINDIIQLLGIAGPQLSKFWTVAGQSSPNTLPAADADGFTLSVDTDEWAAPFAAIVTVDQHDNPHDNLHVPLLQLPDGSSPASGIVLQPSPQVYLALCRLYASILEGKSNSDGPDRPVPRYFFYASEGRIDHTEGSETVHGPQPGIFLPGDRLFMKGKMTIHDEEGVVIDPIAVANALDTFLQTHWTLESKPIGSAQPSGSTAPPFTQPANRQTNRIAQSGGSQKRVYLTDIYNKPFAPDPFPFLNLVNVAGATALYTLGIPNTPIRNASGDGLQQIALSRNGLFGSAADYPSLTSGITLQRDFIRLKAVDWTEHLLGTIPADEPTKKENVLPQINDNEVLSFSFTGNEGLGEVARVLTAGSVEQMVVSTDIQADFTLPPVPNGSGNHLWPQFSQGIAGNTEAISASLEQNITKAAHYITDAATNNTDVYFEIANAAGSNLLKNGWAVRVFHRVFHNDGSETRGDGAGTIVRNGSAAFRLKDPLGINRPFSTVTPPPNATLIVDMVIVNSAVPVQSRRFGNIATTIGAAAALNTDEQGKLLTGTNTLTAVANRGVATSGFLGVRTSASAISNINAANITAFVLASGTQDGSQPRSAAMLPTQSRLEGFAVSKTGANWSAYAGGLRLMKEGRENGMAIANPGSPGGADMHTVGLTTTAGRLAYDLARMGLRRTQNISVRLSRLVNDTDYVLPAVPGATGRTFIAAVLQNIGKKTESPTLAQHQNNTGNLPADAAVLSTQIQQLIGASNTKPPWLPDAIKDQLRTAMTGTQATANHQLALEELKREYTASLFGRRDGFYAIKKAFENARQYIYIETSFFGPTKYPAAPGDPKPADDLIEVLVKGLKAKPGLKLMVCMAQDVPFNRGYENIARFHRKNRHDSAKRLLGAQDETTHRFERENQVVAFHPLGFPGRPLKLNTQTIVVDDVWAISGTGSLSQRGLFFDGSTDVVFCDKQLRRGKSTAIVNLRRNLMLQYLRLDNELPNLPSSNKVFLQDGSKAFEMLKALLRGGGGGMIKPFVPEDLSDISPAETAALNNLADPNGDTFFQTPAALNTFLAALSTVPE